MQLTFISLATRGTNKMNTSVSKPIKGDDCLTQSEKMEVENSLSQLGLTEDQLLCSSQEEMESTPSQKPNAPGKSSAGHSEDPGIPSSIESVNTDDDKDDGIKVVINTPKPVPSKKGPKMDDPMDGEEAEGNVTPRKNLTRSQRKQLKALRESGLSRNEALSKILANEGTVLASSKRTRNDLDKSATVEEDSKPKKMKHQLDPRERAEKSSSSVPQKGGSKRQATGQSYSDMTKRVKVGIIPKDFPTAQLTTAQLDVLQDALLLKVEQQRDEPLKPKFCNLVYKSGYMVLICKDQETAEWVKEITPSINTWEGAELVALNEEDIPRQELLRAFFPQSSTFADERIKALIESQNGLKTTNWRIVKRSILNDIHVEWIFTVDGSSMDMLSKSKFILNYRFGEIQLRKIKRTPSVSNHKPNKELAQENSEEAPDSNSGKRNAISRPKTTMKASVSAPKGKVPSSASIPCSSGTNPKVSKTSSGKEMSEVLTTGAKLAGLDVMGGKNKVLKPNPKQNRDDPQHPKKGDARLDKSGTPKYGA